MEDIQVLINDLKSLKYANSDDRDQGFNIQINYDEAKIIIQALELMQSMDSKYFDFNKIHDHQADAMKHIYPKGILSDKEINDIQLNK